MIDKLKRNDIFKLLMLMKERMPLYVVTVIIKNLVTALCFNIVIAFITKKAFYAVTTGKFYLIRDAAVLALSCYIIGSIIQPVVSLMSNKCVKETMRDIKNSCYKTLAGLDSKALEAEHSGEYISIATNGIANIEELYSVHINMLVFSLFNGIFAMISVLILEWRIGVCILAIGLITVFINKSFALRIRMLTDEIQSKLNKITSKLMDIQSSIENTKMFQAEARVHGIFASENKKHFDISMRLGRVDASYTAINVFFSYFKYIGILCLSLYMLFK